MIRQLALLLTVATLPLVVAPGAAAEIVRLKGQGPAIILQGAVVPEGAETFYLSGQVPDTVDPTKGGQPNLTLADYGDTKTQTISVLNKMKAILASRGYAMSDLVKLTVFLAADPKTGQMDFVGMNEAFRMYFGSTDNPNTVARSTVQVAALVSPAFLVEIEGIAAK